MLKGWRFLGEFNKISIYQQNARYAGVVLGSQESSIPQEFEYISLFEDAILDKVDFGSIDYSYIDLFEDVVLNKVDFLSIDYSYIGIFNNVTLTIGEDNSVNSISLFNSVSLIMDYNIKEYSYISVFNSVELYLDDDIHSEPVLPDGDNHYIGASSKYYVYNEGVDWYDD